MARGVRFLLGFRQYPFLKKTGPGIPVFGYCPFLLVFGLYLLFKIFPTSFISLYSTIMRTCLRRSIYSYVQIMHVSLRLLYYLSVDSYGA